MGHMKTRSIQIAVLAVIAIILPITAAAKSVTRSATSKPSRSISENSGTKQRIRRSQHSRPVARRRRHRRVYERFYTSSFDDNATQGDLTAGEDPMVRQAAVEALGNMNGTVLALDPNSGRILAMVNQKLALSEGAQPCSTIKLSVPLA